MKRSKVSKKIPKKVKAKMNGSRSLWGMMLLAGLLLFLATVHSIFFKESTVSLSSSDSEDSEDSEGEELIVSPLTASMKLASSQAFTSYTQTATGTVPVEVDWTIDDGEDDDDDDGEDDDTDYTETSTDDVDPNSSISANTLAGVTLENCRLSSTCIVHSGATATQFVLRASSSLGDVEIPITIEEELPNNPYDESFPDWAQAAVFTLYDKGIMTGYEDGTFGINDKVTRAQLATLYYKLAEAYGVDTDAFLEKKNCDIFTDVPSTHFAYKPICLGYYGQWFENLDITATTFSPEKYLLRHEVALIITNALSEAGIQQILNIYLLSSNQDMTVDEWLEEQGRYLWFKDLTEETPNRKAIAYVNLFGIMNGSDNLFRPMETLTRLETAQLISKSILVMRWKDVLSDLSSKSKKGKTIEEDNSSRNDSSNRIDIK